MGLPSVGWEAAAANCKRIASHPSVLSLQSAPPDSPVSAHLQLNTSDVVSATHPETYEIFSVDLRLDSAVAMPKKLDELLFFWLSHGHVPFSEPYTGATAYRRRPSLREAASTSARTDLLYPYQKLRTH